MERDGGGEERGSGGVKPQREGSTRGEPARGRVVWAEDGSLCDVCLCGASDGEEEDDAGKDNGRGESVAMAIHLSLSLHPPSFLPPALLERFYTVVGEMARKATTPG